MKVDPTKIIPWDWPASHRPEANHARQRRVTGIFELVYVGSVSTSKGVGDLIRAVAGMEGVALTVVGPQHEALTTAPMFNS